ncbi:hypothetical protein [Microcoleus sp. FACHB-672]|nr:hypothetical protein [Microcoleus sp. FACHB-672]
MALEVKALLPVVPADQVGRVLIQYPAKLIIMAGKGAVASVI